VGERIVVLLLAAACLAGTVNVVAGLRVADPPDESRQSLTFRIIDLVVFVGLTVVFVAIGVLPHGPAREWWQTRSLAIPIGIAAVAFSWTLLRLPVEELHTPDSASEESTLDRATDLAERGEDSGVLGVVSPAFWDLFSTRARADIASAVSAVVGGLCAYSLFRPVNLRNVFTFERGILHSVLAATAFCSACVLVAGSFSAVRRARRGGR
jgi:hypothetical protein